MGKTTAMCKNTEAKNILLKNEQVGPIIQIVMDIARTGKHGDGRIYVYDVSEVIRIRTGERGTDAL